MPRVARHRVVAGALAVALAGCGGGRPVAQGIEAGPIASHAARPGQPVFQASGPDAADYGAGPAGFRPADRYSWWSLENLVDSHSRLDEIHRARPVARAAAPSALRRPPTEPAITYRFAGESRTLDDYLARHPATGLLIARGDTILVERYQYARRDTHRFTSWSMAKTITAMLVGIAIDEGRIRSIDDHPDAYVPELAGTEYGRTPIRDLLTMSSGVKFIEDYSGRDDAALLVWNTFQGEGPGGPAAVVGFNQRLRRSGTRFSYASSETQVLGLVLRAAVGRPLADYLSDRIWRPMGAEADASWLIDNAGMESAYCCVNAVLRDYARLGLLLAHDGRLGGRQIIPSAWIHAATTVPADSWHLKPYAATRHFGYGYQTWIFPGERRVFALFGVRGQAIYVDPASRLVLVHTAIRKLPVDPGGAELYALWAGVREHLGGAP
ncbi:MAG TPA: serine hydrolase [Candidatus Deferrimicrobiaceae bacterium]|nr:serine hydrolase [Candidatus Deferrimicrobiaceae bacterium]